MPPKQKSTFIARRKTTSIVNRKSNFLIPLRDLLLPPPDFFANEFLYSDVPPPSSIHRTLRDTMLSELDKMTVAADKRRLVNHLTEEHLMALADPMPKLRHNPACVNLGHTFKGYRFVSGSTENRTMNIGYWMALVRI
jgi:hypothetical protein